jgi:hypothetical protein
MGVIRDQVVGDDEEEEEGEYIPGSKSDYQDDHIIHTSDIDSEEPIEVREMAPSSDSPAAEQQDEDEEIPEVVVKGKASRKSIKSNASKKPKSTKKNDVEEEEE